MSYRPAETPIHRAVLAYLRLALPGAVIHHSPNALNIAADPKGRAIATKRAKLDGMLTGFPDLLVIWRGQVWGIEVKPEGRKPTEAQEGVGALFERNGARWAVVRSVADAEECVRDWRGAIAGPGEWPWHPPHSESVSREETA